MEFESFDRFTANQAAMFDDDFDDSVQERHQINRYHQKPHRPIMRGTIYKYDIDFTEPVITDKLLDVKRYMIVTLYGDFPIFVTKNVYYQSDKYKYCIVNSKSFDTLSTRFKLYPENLVERNDGKMFLLCYDVCGSTSYFPLI